MRIKIIAVGTKMPSWVESGVSEYLKRFPRDFKVEISEIAVANRGKSASVDKLREKEAEQISAAIPKGDIVVALEVLGKPWSTEKLASNLSQWAMESPRVSILIGGPDGLAPEVSQKADLKWSLSPLTLPHPLVRVLLVEQIYRAWTINLGHPYHK